MARSEREDEEARSRMRPSGPDPRTRRTSGARRERHEDVAGDAAIFWQIASEGFVVLDDAGLIAAFNPAAERLTGIAASQAIGLGLDDLLGLVRAAAVGDLLPGRHERAIIRADGSRVVLDLSLLVQRQGDTKGRFVMLEDATPRARLLHQMRRMASHDLLTGLADRDSFLDLASSRAMGAHHAALLVIALEGSCAKAAGPPPALTDRHRVAAARRIVASMPPLAIAARIDRDAFALFIEGSDVSAARSTATLMQQSLERVLAAALPAEEAAPPAQVRIGVACSRGGVAAATLLADAALAAGQGGEPPDRGRAIVTEPSIRAPMSEQEKLLEALHRAYRDGRFELFYQPQLDLGSGRLVGAEALLRWRDENGRLIPPERFLDVLEASPLMDDVGRWITFEACRQAARWARDGHRLRVAVNLAERQLVEPCIVSSVRDALAMTGLEADQLELEITERVPIDREGQIAAILRELRGLGVGVALDDFGTGRANVAHLRDLAVTRLKIDRSFVADAARDRDAASIVRRLIGLAHDLGLAAVAEGIETADQLAFLRTLHCEEGQGYLFGRPMPAAEFEKAAAAARHRGRGSDAGGVGGRRSVGKVRARETVRLDTSDAA